MTLKVTKIEPGMNQGEDTQDSTQGGNPGQTYPVPTKMNKDEPKNTIEVLDTSFHPWPKTPRWSKEMVTITEKLDGTNAQLLLLPDGQWKAGSRNRWLSAESDNYSFHLWCSQNINELLKLGHGRHYGEWWGLGIQRGYGLFERRFSLFNVVRPYESLPACVSLVPVLYKGPIDPQQIETCMESLTTSGSRAAPGYMKAEGLVIHHLSTQIRYKRLTENDTLHKGEASDIASRTHA